MIWKIGAETNEFNLYCKRVTILFCYDCRNKNTINRVAHKHRIVSLTALQAGMSNIKASADLVSGNEGPPPGSYIAVSLFCPYRAEMGKGGLW